MASAEYERMTFPTRLGWIAMVAHRGRLARLVFGYRTEAAAERALATRGGASATHRGDQERVSLELPGPAGWAPDLRRRLEAYAEGEPADFTDVPLELGEATDFTRRVWLACRAIPYGSTRSYGQLAAEVGSPRAARAVGRCMAGNRIPLIIPCHRVVPVGGRLGRFSAPGGAAMKQRLLQMESAAPAGPVPCATGRGRTGGQAPRA